MSPKGGRFALATSSQPCFVACIFKLTVLIQFHTVGHSGDTTAFLIKESLGANLIGNLASGGKNLLKTRSKGGQTSVLGSDSSGIANRNSPACQNPYKAILAGACLQ